MTRDELLEALLVERFAPPPYRPCGKKTWPSEMVATNFARLVEMAENDGVTRYAYRCDRCGEWHITRQAPMDEEKSA